MRFDYAVDIRGYIRFVDRASGKCLQPDSDLDNAAIVERDCTQVDAQWWSMVEKPGGYRFQNARTESCMQLLGAGHRMQMDDCNDYATTLVTPVQIAKGGITIEPGTAANIKKAPNVAMPGTQSFPMCFMHKISGTPSTVTGTYISGKCRVSFLGRSFEAKSNFTVATAFKDTVWYDAEGRLPETAISIGSRTGPRWGGVKGGKTAYPCRTRASNGSRVGWTLDGQSCYYINNGALTSTKFQVLSRTSRFDMASGRVEKATGKRTLDTMSPGGVIGSLGLSWSSGGRIGGKHCVNWSEGSDPHTWADNFLCTNGDIGMRWSSGGPITGMRCTQILEASDPHTWNDNYLCVPNDSFYRFSWSSGGRPGSSHCIPITEGSEPSSHTWNDNYLCVDYGNPPLVFQVKASGRCFDQTGSNARGAQAHAWDCNPRSPNQQFKLDYRGNTFSLVSQRTKMCMGVAGASMNNGAAVVQWPCVFHGDHSWRKIDRGGGWMSFHRPGSFHLGPPFSTPPQRLTPPPSGRTPS